MTSRFSLRTDSEDSEMMDCFFLLGTTINIKELAVKIQSRKYTADLVEQP